MESPEHSPPTSVPPNGGPPPLPCAVADRRPKPFRPWASVLFGALFVGLLFWGYAPIVQGDVFSYWWYPELTTVKVAEREWAEAQAWKADEGWLSKAIAGESSSEMEAAVLLKLRVAEARFLPGAATNNAGEILIAQAILLNETGQKEAARTKWEELGRIAGREELAALGMDIVEGRLVRYHSQGVQALLGPMEDGWLYRTFQKTATRAAGEIDLSVRWGYYADESGRWAQRVHILMVVLFFSLLFSGGSALFWVLWTSRKGPFFAGPADSLRVGEGLGIWLRGEVLGFLAVVALGWIVFAELQWIVSTVTSLTRGLPLLLLAVHRFHGGGIPWAEGFGIRFPEGHQLKLIVAGLAVFGGDMLLNMVLEPSYRRMEGFEGYTETIRELFVYGPVPYRLLALADGCVFGPFMEELAYRGLVFRALRNRFGFVVSAGVSSALFAGMHFYSLLGLVSVLFFGFVSAWMVERTRSLVPSIVGHCLMNLFILGGQFLYYL
jgi:membrane protease YdiL (CAAX protease family)